MRIPDLNWPTRIPTNFTMPKGYRRKFVFLGESVRLEIMARPPRIILIRQLHLKAEPSPSDYGNGLDWIQESIERMRAEVDR